MRLTKIRIENYRQYRDFELPREGHLGQATLLVAHMGAGKTNLLNAINWCLYDEEMFTVDNNRSLPFINTGRLGEALSPGTESESRIQLSLSLGDDAMARVTRRQVFKVKESGQAEPKSRSELTVQVQAVGDDWVTLTSDDARTGLPGTCQTESGRITCSIWSGCSSSYRTLSLTGCRKRFLRLPR